MSIQVVLSLLIGLSLSIVPIKWVYRLKVPPTPCSSLEHDRSSLEKSDESEFFIESPDELILAVVPDESTKLKLYDSELKSSDWL